MSRFQQQDCQSGTEGQRVECRNHRGNRDGQRELLKEPPDNPGDEDAGNEDRTQDQSHRNHRSGDFIHRFDRRLARHRPLFKVPLDRLDNHNCIVNNDTNGEHQSEQCQRIQTETKNRHRGKRSDHRHRNRHQGNHCRTPAL